MLIVGVVGLVAGCDDNNVGGCEVHTVEIGTEQHRTVEPSDALRVQISSVEFAGKETYRQATQDLIEVIDSLDIQLCNCSELNRVDGPCWPPYFVRLHLDATYTESQALREKLLEVPVAGRLPAAEYPGSDRFWIEAGSLNRSDWALWYAD